MSTSPAITVQNLGKKYNIGRRKHGDLRSSFGALIQGIGKRKNEAFWALKDVSFEVREGSAVGIIGRNGAGKSTLLKLLSRITSPTEGRAEILGRVGSLLEVGTGFHPELTGRENIFLNGTLLGMSRAEVKSKFDEVVEFSGVANFIDTPIKHYSSGMKVRLAFSVAAHLEPEILLIDEVLAVGDAEFQKKCLGKMKDATGHGRTVLFVSHNMAAIERLCDTGILLDHGSASYYESSRAMVDEYLSSFQSSEESSVRSWHDKSQEIRLLKVFSHDSNDELQSVFNHDQRIGLTFVYELIQPELRYKHAINLHNEDGVNVLNSIDLESKDGHKPGTYKATVWVPGNMLNEGNYFFSVACIIPAPYKAYFHEKHIAKIRVGDDGSTPSSRGDYSGNFPGVIRPMLKWESCLTDEDEKAC